MPLNEGWILHVLQQIRNVLATPAQAAFKRLKQTWAQSPTPVQRILGSVSYSLAPTFIQKPHLSFDAYDQAVKLCGTNALTIEFQLPDDLTTDQDVEFTIVFSDRTPNVSQSWINTFSTWQDKLSFDAQIKPFTIEPGQVTCRLHLPKASQAIYLHALQTTSDNVEILSCTLSCTQALKPLLQDVRHRFRSAPKQLHKGSKLLARAARQPSRERLRDIRNWLREQIQNPVTRHSVWQYYFDQITSADRAQICADITQMASPPTFSILMPTYNTPEPLLRAAILSIQRQLYPHWQLCIADDASPMPHVSATIRAFAEKDPRICFVQRQKNGHISEATNSAMRLAKHPWLVLFDHDDELPEHALYMVARAIQANPEAKLIYSDEDKCDTHGNRLDPHFKPDFSPDLLRSQNFVSHLGVYHKDLVEQVGGFRTPFNGSQDYDLVLRVSETLAPSQIVHIPHVLYHWRIIPGSAASNAEQKPYAYIAAEKALTEHLTRTGSIGAVRHGEHLGLYHTRYQVPQTTPKVAIFILNFGISEASAVRSAMSIKRHTHYKNYETHLILGACQPQDTYRLEHDIRAADAIHRTTGEHASALLQALIDKLAPDACIFLQAGAMPTTDDWLEELISNAMRPEIGLVAPRILQSDTTIKHSGIVLAEQGYIHPLYPQASTEHVGYFGKAKLAQNFSLVSPDCFAIQTKRLQEIGGLDPKLGIEANMFELCFKLRRAQYYNTWIPHAPISIAYRGTTPVLNAIAELPKNDRHTLQQRWHEMLIQSDPFYNPNLAFSADASTPSLPPRQVLCFRAG